MSLFASLVAELVISAKGFVGFFYSMLVEVTDKAALVDSWEVCVGTVLRLCWIQRLCR